MSMERARTDAHRGFITSRPRWGGPAGLFFANLAVGPVTLLLIQASWIIAVSAFSELFRASRNGGK